MNVITTIDLTKFNVFNLCPSLGDSFLLDNIGMKILYKTLHIREFSIIKQHLEFNQLHCWMLNCFLLHNCLILNCLILMTSLEERTFAFYSCHSSWESTSFLRELFILGLFARSTKFGRASSGVS